MEWPAKRSFVGLVAVGVQEQAEDILVPPLLRNCLTLNYFYFSPLLSPLQNSAPCTLKMSMMMMMMMMMLTFAAAVDWQVSKASRAR